MLMNIILLITNFFKNLYKIKKPETNSFKIVKSLINESIVCYSDDSKWSLKDDYQIICTYDEKETRYFSKYGLLKLLLKHNKLKQILLLEVDIIDDEIKKLLMELAQQNNYNQSEKIFINRYLINLHKFGRCVDYVTSFNENYEKIILNAIAKNSKKVNLEDFFPTNYKFKDFTPLLTDIYIKFLDIDILLNDNNWDYLIKSNKYKLEEILENLNLSYLSIEQKKRIKYIYPNLDNDTIH
jgi:hypothetical protein